VVRTSAVARSSKPRQTHTLPTEYSQSSRKASFIFAAIKALPDMRGGLVYTRVGFGTFLYASAGAPVTIILEL
jgi:hypothetical protein